MLESRYLFSRALELFPKVYFTGSGSKEAHLPASWHLISAPGTVFRGFLPAPALVSCDGGCASISSAYLLWKLVNRLGICDIVLAHIHSCFVCDIVFCMVCILQSHFNTLTQLIYKWYRDQILHKSLIVCIQRKLTKSWLPMALLWFPLIMLNLWWFEEYAFIIFSFSSLGVFTCIQWRYPKLKIFGSILWNEKLSI